MSARPFAPGLRRSAAPAAVAVVALLLAAGPVAGSRSPLHPSDAVGVLEIYQTPYVTEQSNFSIYLKVAAPQNVSLMYFTFCQLTSPVCYLPIFMKPEATGSAWYVGTTNPMTSYDGMKVGVQAGYNITIDYADGNNVTEPALPNSFANLTIVNSVSDEYMYAMTVRNQLYAITGTVTNATTGAPVAGATVRLSPGTNNTTTNAAGDYSFTDLANGSYSITIAATGYTSDTFGVTVSGANAAKSIGLASTSTGSGPSTSKPSSSSPAISTPLLVGAVAAVAIVAIALVLLVRARKSRPPAGPGSPPSTETAEAPVAPP